MDGKEKQGCFCSKHIGREMEFICTHPGCLSVMCSLCLLGHNSKHFDLVKMVKNVLEETLRDVKEKVGIFEEENLNGDPLIAYDHLNKINVKMINIMDE